MTIAFPPITGRRQETAVERSILRFEFITPLAVMLGVDADKLGREIGSLRKVTRLTIVALLGWVGFVVILTTAAIAILEVSSLASLMPASSAREKALAPRQLTYDAILQRPVFSKTRQPVQIQAALLPQSGMSAANPLERNFILKGVYLNGEVAKAYLVVQGSPVGVWRGRNEEFNGWRLAEVARDQVVLVSQNERLVVPLSFSKNH